MLVLFDHGTPTGLARTLVGHTIHTAQGRGWDTLSNGELLNAAEEAGCDLLLTTDESSCASWPRPKAGFVVDMSAADTTVRETSVGGWWLMPATTNHQLPTTNY